MNILLSSVGRRSYLVDYFKEALNGSGKVVGTNCIPGTTGLLACDIKNVVPAAHEPDFIPTMLDICKKYKIRLLLSLHDLEAPILSKNRKQFDELNTKLIMADDWFIDVCLDKYEMTRFALANGFSVPQTYLNLNDAIDSIEKKEIDFPLAMKARYGFGSLGLNIVCTIEEMKYAYHVSRRLISKSPLTNLTSFVNGNFDDIIIQQAIVGQEICLDVINDLDGNFCTCVVEKIFGMRAGESDSGMTIEHPALFEAGKKLSQLSKHPGVIGADFIETDGKQFLIDLNPRFCGNYPYAQMAGANIPAAIIAWACGKKPNPEWLTATPGVRCMKDIKLVRID